MEKTVTLANSPRLLFKVPLMWTITTWCIRWSSGLSSIGWRTEGWGSPSNWPSCHNLYYSRNYCNIDKGQGKPQLLSNIEIYFLTMFWDFLMMHRPWFYNLEQIRFFSVFFRTEKLILLLIKLRKNLQHLSTVCVLAWDGSSSFLNI